jgi:hypothetical protein
MVELYTSQPDLLRLVLTQAAQLRRLRNGSEICFARTATQQISDMCRRYRLFGGEGPRPDGGLDNEL